MLKRKHIVFLILAAVLMVAFWFYGKSFVSKKNEIYFSEQISKVYSDIQNGYKQTYGAYADSPEKIGNVVKSIQSVVCYTELQEMPEQLRSTLDASTTPYMSKDGFRITCFGRSAENNRVKPIYSLSSDGTVFKLNE